MVGTLSNATAGASWAGTSRVQGNVLGGWSDRPEPFGPS